MNTVMREGEISRRRITVEEYYRMAEIGLLAPDARVELIDGEIVDMAPIGSRHGGAVLRLNRLLTRAVGDRAIVAVQHPVRLGDSSEPQPDIAVLKTRHDDYAGSHPAPTDTLLIVEVSEPSLRRALQIKAPLYARHGIPEVWIVDIKGAQIHFFCSPEDRLYTQVSVERTLGVVNLAMLTDVTVDLSAIFSA